MRIYIAAPYAARAQVADAATFLAEHGHECTSTWKDGSREIHDGTVGTSAVSTDEEVTKHAGGDLKDIKDSDLLVAFTSEYVTRTQDIPERWLHTGGRHVEMGYALALELPIIVVGTPENVFQRAAFCLEAHDLQDVVNIIDEFIRPF